MCVESEEESALISFAVVLSRGALPSFIEGKSHEILCVISEDGWFFIFISDYLSDYFTWINKRGHLLP